jgi:hypothetical protein
VLALAVGTLVVFHQTETMTAPTASHKPPFGYLGVLIAYNNGAPVGAQVAGHADTLQECLKNGQEVVGKLLQEAPSSVTGAMACVPIPAAPAHTTVDRPTKPTPEQKETTL